MTKRTIKTVSPIQEISVFEWIPGDSKQSATLKDLNSESASLQVESYNFNEFSKAKTANNWYVFTLIYDKGKVIEAEQVFDQIISTFKFLDQDQTSVNTDSQSCTEGMKELKAGYICCSGLEIGTNKFGTKFCIPKGVILD